MGVIVASGLVAIPLWLAGADLDGGGFIIVSTIVQDLVMIAAAYFVTADLGSPNARTFGLRPFKSSAFGWMFVALVTYLIPDLHLHGARRSAVRAVAERGSRMPIRTCSWRS